MRRLMIRLMGGLGNQLHCFAMGRAIARRNGAELIVDSESGYWSDPYGRTYMLGHFPHIHARKLQHATFPGYRTAVKMALKAAQRVSRHLPTPLKLVVEEGPLPRFRPDLLHADYRLSPYVIGYWATYRYYEGIEAELRSELEPPLPQNADALALLKQIGSSNSCMVHWRSYAEESNARRPNMRDYYDKALAVLRERCPTVHFFIFSDRPDLLTSTLDVGSPHITVVNLPSLSDEERTLAEFYLMFRCRHAIIGDSTFSWWAAWLGQPSDRVIVAPSGLSPWGDDWAPQEWVTIPVARGG